MENNKKDTSINFKFDSLEYETAIKYFRFNNDLTSNKAKELWLRILQLFFYSNKIDKEIILMNKVLTYLYTGKLGDGTSFNPKNVEVFLKDISTKKMVANYFKHKGIADLNLKKSFFLMLYKLYLKILCKYFWYDEKGSKRDNTFGKILIYEAPPFKKEPNFVDHFMLNGDKYLNALDVKKAKQSAYKLTNRCKKRIEAFTSKYNQFIYKVSLEKVKEYNDQMNCWLKTKNKKNLNELTEEERTEWKEFEKKLKKITPYYICENKDFQNNLKKAVMSEIVYIDLILAPINIDSVLRNAWSTNEEFLFEDKQLPVILFEWAIEHFKHNTRNFRMKNKKEVQLFSNNCLIAFGTPLNTSVSIYEYFVDEMYKIDEYLSDGDKIENHIDLTQLNSPISFRKFNNRGHGVVFPMFKSNVIGGNRYPDPLLVKHAFDIPNN